MILRLILEWSDADPKWNGEPRWVATTVGTSPEIAPIEFGVVEDPTLPHVIARSVLSRSLESIAEKMKIQVGDEFTLGTDDVRIVADCIREVADAYAAEGKGVKLHWQKMHAGLQASGEVRVIRKG
jgi:hypothetical protein